MSLLPTPDDELKELEFYKGQSRIKDDWIVGLDSEIERLRKSIITAMNTTHDDDTHEFLDRVLKGKENEAPSYRIKVEDE